MGIVHLITSCVRGSVCDERHSIDEYIVEDALRGKFPISTVKLSWIVLQY